MEIKKVKDCRSSYCRAVVLSCAAVNLVVCGGLAGVNKFIVAGIDRIKGKLFNRLSIFSVSLT